MAIRFMTGRGTDIVTMSHHGFVVGTPEEFLALQRAAAATDPAKPHPWPIEEFLGSHPSALKFVQDNAAVPASFTTESFFGNDTFRFVDSNGNARIGRYQIVPLNGTQFLDESAAKTKSPDFLREDLRTRLAAGAVKYRLLLQVAAPGDRTDDPSIVWPDDRKKIELGIITISSVSADSAQAEKDLAFDPARLTDGIELSDDPFPALRSRVYAISAAGRRNH
jgi:catalase